VAARAAVVALVLAGGLLAAAAAPADELVVIREDGRRMWTLPVRPGDEVVLVYTNSIYGARTEERLVLTRGGFALREVRSTSEAVLAYNGLQAPYGRRGGLYTAAASARLDALVLRVGHTGRPRLVVHGRELPLYQAGEGVQVRVELHRR